MQLAITEYEKRLSQANVSTIEMKSFCEEKGVLMDEIETKNALLVSKRINSRIVTFSFKKHWWFSGRILACHAGGPGSIPGQCKFFFCAFKLFAARFLISLVA